MHRIPARKCKLCKEATLLLLPLGTPAYSVSPYAKDKQARGCPNCDRIHARPTPPSAEPPTLYTNLPAKATPQHQSNQCYVCERKWPVRFGHCPCCLEALRASASPAMTDPEAEIAACEFGFGWWLYHRGIV